MPLHGSLSLAADGTFVYAPAANYNGPDTFTYRANDGTANSGIATVRLTITAVNDPPVAVDDAYTGDEDTPITIASAAAGVLGNDTDPENDTLTAAVVTPPSHGAVVLNASGTFTYTPAADYNGADSFTYRARDAALDSNTATVRITLRGVNDPPVAVNDAYSTNEDTPLTIAAANLGVLANDTDPDVPAQTLTAILVSTTTRGTLTFNGNGTFTYSPQPNFNGADTFTYRASDGAAQSNIATVTITVSAVNDPPVARNDSYFTNEDTALTVPPPGVLVNDSDVDNDINAAIVTIVVQPTSGVLSNVAAGGFRYTPNSNFTGTDTFTYRLSDGAANSNIATVSIIVQALNDPPIAVDDSYTTAEDTPLSVAAPGVLGNDTDPDSPPSSLSAQLVSPPLGAAFALNPNGSFSYTPSPEFNGDVTFTYRVSDGAATSAPATVTIHVTPVNDAPVAVDDAYTAAPNTPLTINAPGVLGNDFDIDSASLTAALAMPPVHGSVVLAAAGGFVYTPATDYTGPDAFTYRASDGALSSNIATVSITIVAGGNLPPIARCRDVTIDARHTCPDSFSVTPEDVNNGSSDPDDPTKSLVLTLSSKGPFGIGVTEVTLTVTDPHGASSTCTARITVLGEDCNNNGAPDACDIGSGGSADCNHDGVPDECQCLWDNGMGTPASDGRYSQLGGRSQTAPKVADDFYIEPGQVCHVATFTGQMLTNLAPARRQARLEFYEDCDGAPAGDPIAVFANSTVLAAEPAVGPGGSGYFLVTFSFDLCSANLWLDGGKTYWVSLYALATCSDSSQSYWAAAPGAMRGSVPHVAMGHPSPTQCTTVRYDPWLTGETCCGDCENLAFKLGGAVCPIIWDNGPYWHCPGGGGLISGRVGAYQSRSADNFVIKPCDDQTICFLEATIWTNGNPATGFVEIYANDCKQPADRLFTATVSRAIPTGQTLRLGGVDVQAYVLQFYDLGWTLPAGRTYWLSAGATCAGGSINQRAYFAIADMCGTDCNIKISPAWMGNVGVGGTVMWCPKHEDLAFRIAALPGVVAPAHHSQPLATCPVDLDGDGHAGVQDLFAYLTAWFAGCP
jgi:VCBS repeat-containing protein